MSATKNKVKCLMCEYANIPFNEIRIFAKLGKCVDDDTQKQVEKTNADDHEENEVIGVAPEG